MSSRNMILRLGVDASDFQKKMAQAGASSESTSKRIKKNMTMNLGSEVSKIMGWNGATSGFTSINAGNFEAARDQLFTLQSYRDQMAGAGFDDYQFGLVSERIKVLEYELDAYTQSLSRAADAEREASHEADNLGDETRKAEIPVSSASRTLREMGNSGRRLSTVSSFLRQIRNGAHSSTGSLERMVRTIRNVSVVSFGLRLVRGLFGELGTIVRQQVSENAALQAQVNGLKSALGQALAPAIGVVTNALSYLLPYVVGISNAFSTLMGSLFGTGWAAAAAGANKTAVATGGAAKAQKELNRQLLSFDQINRVEGQGDSGGGGGGASAAITPIEPKTPAWMERFRSSFSELFNSSEFQGSNIGGKIGLAIQTGIDWIGTEAMNFDWSGAGAKIRENFSSMIGKIDLAPALQGFGKSIGAVLGIGIGMIADTFREPWRKFSEQMLLDMETFGVDAMTGFFMGIGRGLGNLGAWLWDNFVKPLIDGVKEGLGIHSPSTVFAEIGENCMSGLINGFSNGITWVLQKLTDLRDRVVDAANTLKDAFSFEWRMPHLRLPHLNVQWDPVDNILANFFGVTAFPRLNVDWYAKGFITNGTSIFNGIGIGERGREALLPLDSNDGWKDEIAHRIAMILQRSSGGDVNATINLVVDGDVLTSYVIKNLRRRSRSGAPSF